MLDFPNSPALNDVFQDWRWDGVRWVGVPVPPVVPVNPNCGRLIASAPISVRLVPYNGDTIKVAGEMTQIPVSGSDCLYVGLAPSTLYYIYWNGAVLSASTIPHVVDDRPGNDGIHIMMGNSDQSLVGMAYTETTGMFADNPAKRYVASWFNRRRRTVHQVLGGPFQPGSSFVQYGPDTSFLSWKDEVFMMNFFGIGTYTGTFNMGIRLLSNHGGSASMMQSMTVMNGQFRNLMTPLSVSPISRSDDGLTTVQMQANCLSGTRSLEDTAFNGYVMQ